MENMKLTLSEQDFREWGAHRIKLITRTKDEIKKQHTIVRNAEACLDRLARQLEALENQAT